jgi:hypothetical protein
MCKHLPSASVQSAKLRKKTVKASALTVFVFYKMFLTLKMPKIKGISSSLFSIK